MRICFISIFCFLLFWQASAQSVFVLDAQVLKENKRMLQSGSNSLKPAYNRLLSDAKKAMQFGPVSVMEKKQIPPSGDKHDYMSIAPYHWPNPDTKDGLPYIRKDGQTNPEVNDFKDKEYLPALCEHVYVLGLAYYFSGDESYAKHAAELLQVWFLKKETKMNPNLNFGQAVKGVNTGRGSGLIDTRHFVKLIDGIGLIQSSTQWTKEDQRGMQIWFTDFLLWMEESEIGKQEMNAGNNHGVWYDAQRLAMALFIGNQAKAKSLVAHAMERLDTQMDATGRFPREMERTISLHYNVFVIDAFLAIASMADDAGMSIWNQITPTGKSIERAVRTFVPYLNKQKVWDGPQIKPYPDHESIGLLAYAGSRYNCTNCWQDIEKLQPENYHSLRIHLLTLPH